MTKNVSIELCRGQHVRVFDALGQLRLVIDHPANSPLLGTVGQVVRSAEIAIEPSDTTVSVYAASGGAALQIATAMVQSGRGATNLTDWQIEPQFEHSRNLRGTAAIHRVIPLGDRRT